MGAAAVHHPHDCLMHQHHALSHQSLPFLTPSPSNNLHENARSLNGPRPAHVARRKRTPLPVAPPSKTTPPPPDSPKNLLMGQVKILRRGEELPGRVNGFYAGSAAFVTSPHPSSVPLPGFLACDSATSDLRRILRLD